MNIHAYLVTLYAILIIVGGVMGFIKAASIASLAMGVLFGVLLLGTSFAMYKGNRVGFWTAVFLTAVLLAFFLYRYLLSGAMIPAGVMTLVSLLVLVGLFSVRKQ